MRMVSRSTKSILPSIYKTQYLLLDKEIRLHYQNKYFVLKSNVKQLLMKKDK